MDLAVLTAAPAVTYLAIVLMVAFDAIIPAVPSEVAVVTAGTLAAAGDANVAWAVAAAVSGALAGDYAMYAIGRHTLPRSLSRTRLGRSVQATLTRAHARMGSASALAITAGRFVPLGRTASAAVAGLAGFDRRTFLLCSVIGGTAWASAMVAIGYTTGSATSAPLWLQSAIGAGIALVVGVWIATIHAVVRTRRRMSARAAALRAEPPRSVEPSPC